MKGDCGLISWPLCISALSNYLTDYSLTDHYTLFLSFEFELLSLFPEYLGQLVDFRNKPEHFKNQHGKGDMKISLILNESGQEAREIVKHSVSSISGCYVTVKSGH